VVSATDPYGRRDASGKWHDCRKLRRHPKYLLSRVFKNSVFPAHVLVVHRANKRWDVSYRAYVVWNGG
jgi:hypothetical protein